MNKESNAQPEKGLVQFGDQNQRLQVITNITLEPYLSHLLQQKFSRLSVPIVVSIVSPENLQEIQAQTQNNVLTVVLFHFETQFPNWYNDLLSKKTSCCQFEKQLIEHCYHIYQTIKVSSPGSVLWFGYELTSCPIFQICGFLSPFDGIICRVNDKLCAMMESGDVFINTDYLISSIGLSCAYDAKNKYRWNAPYSTEMIQALSDEIYKQYMIYKGITKKCLILDCDGVLWGGILAEDGAEQIRLGNEGLGRQYQDFQRFLLTLYYHGVILTVCSKNDIQDILYVFREHSGMLLKEEHIACFQVNWNSKSENILKIADALNISLDSIVFVDDSEFEVESVRMLLPEVLSILYDRNTIYSSLSCFNLKSQVNLEWVANRNLTYQTNNQRKQMLSESSDYIDYLNALEIKVDIHKTTVSELSRISELTQRTNQCTNGTRYDIIEISAHFHNPFYQMYSVYISDKFSNLGLVGAIGIHEDTLDMFSLSCRALGRHVENKMMDLIIKNKVVFFKFKSTEKNETLHNFLKTCLISK